MGLIFAHSRLNVVKHGGATWQAVGQPLMKIELHVFTHVQFWELAARFSDVAELVVTDI